MNSKKILISCLLVLACSVASSYAFCDQDIVVANDGSAYDLTPIMGSVIEVFHSASDYKVDISICQVLDEFCELDFCTSCGSASGHPNTCYGIYDEFTFIDALGNNTGVVITYNHGANCTGCIDGVYRRTILKLMCNDWLPDGYIETYNMTAIKVNEADLVVLAEMYCVSPNVPFNENTPEYNAEPVLQIDYYNEHKRCNASEAQVIDQKYTTDCEPGCFHSHPFWVYRTCGEKLVIEKKQWVQIAHFEDNQCDSLNAVTYVATDACFGDLEFTGMNCTADAVQFLDCKRDPFCNTCQSFNTIETGACQSDASIYQCVNGRRNMIEF